jgi:hypothetical protein
MLQRPITHCVRRHCNVLCVMYGCKHGLCAATAVAIHASPVAACPLDTVLLEGTTWCMHSLLQMPHLLSLQQCVCWCVSLQVLKVTLRSAGDLHNLLIDPQGAAAAAAAGQGFSLRLAAIAHPLAGGSSSGGGGVVAEGLAGLSAAADAANMARQRVQDMTSNGQAAARSLLANTKAWFKDRKPSSAAAAARKAELGQSSGRLSPIPDSTPPSPRHPLIATTAAAGGSRPVTPEPGGATGSGSSDRGAATAAAAAAGGGPVVVQAGDATPSPRSIAGSSPVPGDFLTKGSGSGSGTAPLLDSRDGTEQGLGAAAGGSQQLEGGSPRVQGGSPLPGPSPLGLLRSSMDSNFNSSPTAAQASSSRFEDPGPGPAHARIPSVDADAVMSMLEDNGFHASDAPGGNFFYMRVTCGEEAGVSRMVGLGPSGDAVWGQVRKGLGEVGGGGP